MRKCIVRTIELQAREAPREEADLVGEGKRVLLRLPRLLLGFVAAEAGVAVIHLLHSPPTPNIGHSRIHVSIAMNRFAHLMASSLHCSLRKS